MKTVKGTVYACSNCSPKSCFTTRRYTKFVMASLIGATPILSSDSTACLQPHTLVGFQPQRPLCRERLAADQVGEAVARPVHPQLVGIHLLRMIGEIGHYE